MKFKLLNKFLLLTIISTISVGISGCSNNTEQSSKSSTSDIDSEGISELSEDVPAIGESTGGHDPNGLPDNTPVNGGGNGKNMPIPKDSELPSEEMPPIGEATNGHDPNSENGMPERPMSTGNNE